MKAKILLFMRPSNERLGYMALNIAALPSHQPTNQHSRWTEQQSAPKRREDHD
jgi:hypothetical protein